MKTDYVKVFGRNVARLREQRGMTQLELAKRLKISAVPYISRVENGAGANISVRQCERFARALGLALEDLFDARDGGKHGA